MLNQDQSNIGENMLLSKQQTGTILISDVMECMGLTRHHWNVIYLVFCCWAIVGWLDTAIVYVLDGASEADSNWVLITSPKDRLSVQDRSWALLICGFVALSGNALMGYSSDKFGRIFTTTLCLVPVPLITMGIAHASSKIVLFAFLFCMFWFKDGPLSVTNCLLAEWLPIAYRGSFLVLVHMLWNVGRVCVTLLWIAVPPEDHWRSFCYCVAIFPTVLGCFLFLYGHRLRVQGGSSSVETKNSALNA
jgi:MFS family permease